MTRFLTTTAIGLMLGLAPAFAETQAPMTATETAPALQQPAESSAAMPGNPADPTNPATSSQVPPEVMGPFRRPVAIFRRPEVAGSGSVHRFIAGGLALPREAGREPVAGSQSDRPNGAGRQ